MAARIVHGACPHDCPDTCAMHVTVEGGRATKVSGDPDHPITVGFLCGKVSNYLDRVYSEDRVLHPRVREHGALRRASWDEALDRVAAGLTEAREQFGGESILPYSYMGTQGLIQGNLMGARVMNARSAPRRSSGPSAPARGSRVPSRPTASRPRSIPRSGRTRASYCSGAGTRSRPLRTCGASCSTPASRERASSWSTRFAAARLGWPTSI